MNSSQLNLRDWIAPINGAISKIGGLVFVFNFIPLNAMTSRQFRTFEENAKNISHKT